MKTSVMLALIAGLNWAATPVRSQAGGNSGRPTDSDSTGPVITSIRLEGTNVVVRAKVPAGITKVTLESCRRPGIEAWIPKVVGRLNGAGGEMTFRLAQSPDLDLLRIRADVREALPASFYQGPSSFAGQPVVGGLPMQGPLAELAAGGNTTPNGSIAFVPLNAAAPTQARAVTESDVWKISDDTLYFFNQYRGLQVIDISQPDAPVLRAALSIPAAGEQMYLLDETHLVLLARDDCNRANDAQCQVLVVEMNGGNPAVIAKLPIEGTIQESRLVGTALYVASTIFREAETAAGKQWESGTEVRSFDLSQPNQPVTRSTEWAPGGGSVIAATDRFLFVAGSDVAEDADRSVIRVYDIGAADGTLAVLSTIRPIGQVQDKFKMNLDGDVFTVVSAHFTPVSGQWPGTTYVETFSLTNPRTPTRLGSLNLIQGESLFATRFDSNRLYVVTFLRIDPLWVIDLSDPARPRVAGQIEIPGWSTYIHPLGDRLVTIGQENPHGQRTVVSLFNVGDPAHPALLNRAVLPEEYSSSEANLDEKALGVLPEAGLILVPFSSRTTNGDFQGVQLLDLSRDAVALRGRIEHELQARRATLQRGRIISVSGRELLSVDATDRDHPLVRAAVPLSWRVDQVFVTGQHLLEIDRGQDNSFGLQVRVTPADDPNLLLSRLSLTNLPYLGAALHGDRLYLAQGQSTRVNWQWDPVQQISVPVSTNLGTFSLTVVDVSQLPALTVSGQTQVSAADDLSGVWSALWPKTGLLVWKSSRRPAPTWGVFSFGGLPTAPFPVSGIPIGGGLVSIWNWRVPGGDGRLVAFNVINSAAPEFVSDLALGRDSLGGEFSQAFIGDGLVYLSHREFELKATGTNYYIYTNAIIDAVTNVAIVTNVTTANIEGEANCDYIKREVVVTNEWPILTWLEHNYLDVVDYSVPANPVVRPPVNLPGALQGISHGGALLYTAAQRAAIEGGDDSAQWLDASAYDGVEVHLVDSLSLANPSLPPLLVRDDATIFLAAAAPDDQSTPRVEAWTLPETGKFAKLGAAPLGLAAQKLLAFGQMLAVQEYSGIQLFNAGKPSNLTLIGGGGPDGCLGYSLEDADGSVDRGLWLPLGNYGACRLGLTLNRSAP
jgi:hypothetical protein